MQSGIYSIFVLYSLLIVNLIHLLFKKGSNKDITVIFMSLFGCITFISTTENYPITRLSNLTKSPLTSRFLRRIKL